MKTRIVGVVWALSVGLTVQQYALADQAAPQPQTARTQVSIAAADPQTAAPQGQAPAPGGQS